MNGFDSLACHGQLRVLVLVVAAGMVTACGSGVSPNEVSGRSLHQMALCSAEPGDAGPTVSGPIPATVQPGDVLRDYPFFATQFDIAAQGYIEQEFFIEGTATRYDTPAQASGSVIDSGHPYKTRIMVRRPASRARANGVVVIEWFNVTNGWDSDTFWYHQYEHLLRNGYTYVGVSAQSAGVNFLNGWSPKRYGTLDVDVGGGVSGLQYDIFSQAVAAIRCPKGIDPLNDLAVHTVIALGDSQSASQLTTYYNSIQPLTELIDAFVLRGNLGNLLRTDLPVKVLKIQSETEVWLAAAFDLIGEGQPDSDTLRTWEVTGASHGDYRQDQGRTPQAHRDVGVPTEPVVCARPPLSRIPYYQVMNAGLESVMNWLADGTPPAISPRISVLVQEPTRAIIVRDAYGNAQGGIRLPDMAVPTATNTGENVGTNVINCALRGSHEPFNDITLSTLYPDHETYFAAVAAAVEQRIQEGFLLPEDAEETLRAAELADVPPGSLQDAVWTVLPP